MGEQTLWGVMSVTLNKMKPYLAMISLQFGYAGMHIVTLVSFKRGFSNWILVVYRHAAATLVFAHFAYFLEKKIRSKMTKSIFFKIMVLAFLEPVLDQNLYGVGIQYTSATFAAASVNVLPAITFIMAVIFRMEKVNLQNIHSLAKVIGTLITVTGSMVITMYKSPALGIFHSGSHHKAATSSADQHWATGTIMMLSCIVGWAAFFIFQGIVCSGIAYYLQSVVNKVRGPVFVTAFSPLSMIITAVLGAMILAEQVHLGSLIGAVIIVCGLYFVVWGKSKESSSYDEGKAQELPVVDADIIQINVNPKIHDKNPLQQEP